MTFLLPSRVCPRCRVLFDWTTACPLCTGGPKTLPVDEVSMSSGDTGSVPWAMTADPATRPKWASALPHPLPPEWAPRLYTCSYGLYRVDMGLPVRTSVGGPRGWRHGSLPYLAELTPHGIFGRNLPELSYDEYRPRYRARLADFGVAVLIERFRGLAATHCAHALVFLCYEDVRKPGNWCHRRMFAEWWEEQTGVAVPEASIALAPPRPQGNLF